MTEQLGNMIERLHNLKETMKEIRNETGKLELEIIQLMQANDQSLFEDTKFKARIPVKREYDAQRFVSIMGEILSPEQLDEVYSPAHTIEKQVPASANGVKAKKLWDMGMAEKLKQTLLPNKRQLKIEEKKWDGAL
jgi:regulator of replication initiation timing